MARMPVLFVGHGSPMNAIENNRYTAQWEALGTRLPRPEAILSVSAHWFTRGTKIADTDAPETIYDMYGFPKALYQIQYNAPGAPRLAREAERLIRRSVAVDNTWGLDHGTWSVLRRIYPQADIPVFQLSVDRSAPAEVHYQIGRELRSLRDQGVLLLGSGNIVHNLALVDWTLNGGYAWAEDFDGYIRQRILEGRHEDVAHFERAGASAALAVPLMDHFAPLLYVLGAAGEDDPVSFFNNGYVLGSLSMTCCLLGEAE
ncbi:MAG: 4,5-DOPA dioxygenase extradiol [Candidatus Limiplasma sp.]|nr:4,5-DOPA dioxygenase extradiol [Candidatus Limiplasma sp.]